MTTLSDTLRYTFACLRKIWRKANSPKPLLIDYTSRSGTQVLIIKQTSRFQ